MFSVSFGEMFVILLVCLLVVGPKRLPTMARYAGHLLGRINRHASTVKREIRREIEIEDLRQAKEDAEQAAMQVKDDIAEVARMADKPSVQTKQD